MKGDNIQFTDGGVIEGKVGNTSNIQLIGDNLIEARISTATIQFSGAGIIKGQVQQHQEIGKINFVGSAPIILDDHTEDLESSEEVEQLGDIT